MQFKEEKAIGINIRKTTGPPPKSNQKRRPRQRESNPKKPSKQKEKKESIASLFCIFNYDKGAKKVLLIFEDIEYYHRFCKEKEGLLKKLYKDGNIPEPIPVVVREDRSWLRVSYDGGTEYAEGSPPNIIKKYDKKVFIRWIETAQEEEVDECFLLVVPRVKRIKQVLELM